ncbi:MAG TPA: M13 family metallopeptidase, partial [Bacteroidia bacterium]|nr:M13 family metallopeptidase [Bacteroidia bacterium]
KWGSFDVANDTSLHRLHKILIEAAAKKDKKEGSVEQKVGDYFAVAFDSAKQNNDGIAPLKDELSKINSISDNKSLWAEAARLMKLGSNVMFKFTVGQDDKISSKEICRIEQGGMLLPAKDYYTDTTERMKMIRNKYAEYQTALFEQMGEKHEAAEADAKKVISMETDLAISAMSQTEERDVHATYNKMTGAELEKMTPNIDWATCKEVFGLKSIDSVLVAQPEFMKKVSAAAKSFTIDDWKTYLRLHLVSNESVRLGDAIATINFNFWGKTMMGTKEMKPRWKRAVEATSAAVGELLGQLYVAQYFDAKAKEKVHSMVVNIIAAYKDRIHALKWMSSETKNYAISKLDKITLKLCYPDKWKDYSALEIKNDAYVLNSFRVSEYNFNYNINRLGKPVDRTEWEMSPQTINAYYEPPLNEICFPAGILQPPFFDPNRDDAMNYGGIGAVIGHELTHGFDDQGNQYDADGNMRKWWTDADSVHYFSKLGIVIRQFDNFEMDSVHVKGKLTIGENTADLGGITIAYQAFENQLKAHPEGIIDGFTPEQRFFISFAQVWRQNARPAYIRQLVNTNPHSPPRFRVLGPLA